MAVSLVESGAALLSMRNSDFDVYSAYGEVIDNSIQAKADEIKIHLFYSTATHQAKKEAIEKIAFGDNGCGMPADVLHRCLQLGYSSRFNDRAGIGRFGVGATLAAINQCKRIDLYSKERLGQWLYTYIDLDMITTNPPSMIEIPSPISKEPPQEYKHLVGAQSGTLVVWSKYDRQEDSASEIRKEFRIWTGRTYRKFIWDGTKIYINNEIVHAIDPLYVETKLTQFPKDPKAHEYAPKKLSWPIPTEDSVRGEPAQSTILIRMSLLPESFRPNLGSGNTGEAKARHIHLNTGISILRNQREVFYGSVPNWPGARFEEIDRWWGCEISFDAVLDKDFSVKNIKRGAVPVSELKKSLKDQIEPTRNTALEIVREVWAKEKASRSTTDTESTTHTGHEAAERIAKDTSMPRSLIDKGKNIDKESERITEKWLADSSAQVKAAWTAKFKSQPYTMLNGEWKGPEFFEVNHLGGNDVLRYNMRHIFQLEIESIQQALSKAVPEEVNAQKLRTLIDLLLMSYAKSEAMFDKDIAMTADKFLEQLRMSWGNYLTNYLDTYKRESKEGDE